MSPRIFGLLVLAVIAVVVVIVLSWPNPGKKVFEREQIALQDVSSWRMNMEISQRGSLAVRRTHEAVCPDREHITERAVYDFAEYVRIGDDVYYRKNGQAWTKGMPGPDLFFPLPTPRPCLTDPGQSKSQPPGGAEETRLALQYDIDKGKFEQGELKQVKDTSCREWKVTLFTPRNQLGSYTTCLGESDFLPRQIQSLNQSYTEYFEWDVPVTVEPPDLSSFPTR